MNNAEKIQAVLNTLDNIEIKATYDNLNRMLGIHKVLIGIRDELAKQAEKAQTEEVKKEDV